MTYALPQTDIATASKYLADATDVTVRKRILPAFLDEEGRVNRNATGKDLNWVIDYKQPVAVPYTGQQLTFNNDNFLLPASVVPAFWINTSGMNYIDITMNSGPTMIVNNYLARAKKMVLSMEIKLAKDLYSYAPTNTKSIIGITTLTARNQTLLCTNADRMAVPIAGAQYAGLLLQQGSYGGSWSNVIPTAQQMSTVLGSDWPDGQGSPDQLYDCTTPRLYNENTNQWLSPPGTAAANGSWAVNCIAMLSRANTDLGQNSVKTMMPNIHLSGSGRHQAVKDALRTAFRDTQMNGRAAEMLGYYDAMNYENAAIATDHECPADRTLSVCAASMDLHFYGENSEEAGSGAKVASGMASDGGSNSQTITGGIYTMFGPTHVPGSLDWVWIIVAGGFSRYNPKWVACHKDYTSGV